MGAEPVDVEEPRKEVAMCPVEERPVVGGSE